MDRRAAHPDLVSVIIPTYNRADVLIEALESVRRQAYRPIEVLIVDDGSTDDTQSRARQWIQKTTAEDTLQATYLRQNNAGPSAARNRGLIAATGAYIDFLDSDDLLHPARLTSHVSVLKESPSAAMAYSYSRPFHTRPVEEKIFAQPYGSTFTTKLKNIPNAIWRCTYTRELCRLIGPWNENLPLWEDWEYSVRAASLQVQGCQIDDVLHFRRQHQSDQLSDRNRSAHGVDDVLRAMEAVDTVLSEAYNAFLPTSALSMHLRGIIQALLYGSSDQLERAFASWKGHHPRGARAVLVRTLEGLYRSFGKEYTRGLYKFYASVRSAPDPGS
jgi:glycosyltransferase involved in cell wall biosynthesis